MIRMEGLTRKFGAVTAVNEVSLQVDRGDIFGLVGPDGAGKTTLLRLACGLINPTSGRVTLFGGEKDTGSFGYMPQRFSLCGDLTVIENIEFFASLYQIDKKTIKKRAGEILELTKLVPFKTRFADALSGGMKQKLALTCALVIQPEMLILDEPTFGVDPEFRKEFWRILYLLNREGMTIFLSTPYMDEAELCRQVALLDQGRIVAVGAPDQLKKQIKHKIIEIKADAKDLDFLGELPEVADASFYGDRYHVAVLAVEPAKAAIASVLAAKGITVSITEEITPSMEDVFVSLTEKAVSMAYGWVPQDVA
ncbi:MAG: ABC transporter ATP-binding protein [Peptococcaceae bacterium]|nr:ABC transporter ATP-binding protein [Candidatus Syntrophopropionicum ammoniitolerans]